MNKNKLFERIVEEAKKEIIDPVIWVLYFQFGIVGGRTHAEYIKTVAERYKHNSKILRQLEPYLELWEKEMNH